MTNEEMTAFEAFEAILNINETIEDLKSRNTDNIPDLLSCKSVELLIQYRQLLKQVMKKTVLGVFEGDD